jgi:hypothetical protein
MSRVLHRLAEVFSLKTKSGYAVPQKALVYETPCVPLADVMKLYERDPTCKASVDLLAASAVGAGFYTTVDENYEKAGEAKRTVDRFNEDVNLDALLCELVEVDEELWSDDECASRANALLASLKEPAEQLTFRSTVVDYGNTPLLPGDKVHVTLPNEGVDGDFRILSAEYNVDAKTQVLETMLELGREKPLLADYMFILKSKTDSLSRYKLARV